MPGIKSNYIHTYTIMVELLPKGKCELDKKNIYIYVYVCLFCSQLSQSHTLLFLDFLTICLR